MKSQLSSWNFSNFHPISTKHRKIEEKRTPKNYSCMKFESLKKLSNNIIIIAEEYQNKMYEKIKIIQNEIESLFCWLYTRYSRLVGHTILVLSYLSTSLLLFCGFLRMNERRKEELIDERRPWAASKEYILCWGGAFIRKQRVLLTHCILLHYICEIYTQYSSAELEITEKSLLLWVGLLLLLWLHQCVVVQFLYYFVHIERERSIAAFVYNTLWIRAQSDYALESGSNLNIFWVSWAPLIDS